ncbi:MAG: MFS transporter [Duodenibacillus sp.]|nr:MFS transporter [Duodenibacillus sp.]
MLLRPRLGFVLACILLDALGIGLIIPVLPRLIGVLSDSPADQTWWYGALMLSYGLMQFACAPALGAASDRIGRRPILLCGMLGLGIMFAVPAFSDSLGWILASRIAGGALSANMAVAQAYVADISEGRARVEGFGKIGAAFGVGMVLGPAIGGVMGDADPHVPFVIASVICLLNFVYGALVLPESLAPGTAGADKRGNPFVPVLRLFRAREQRGLVMVLGLTSLANGVLQCTWALYSEFRYGFTPMGIGLSVFALGACISLAQGCGLKPLLRRCEEINIALAAVLTAAACLLAIALSPSGAWAVAALCCYAAASLVSPLITGAISARTSSVSQGVTIGALSSLNALAGACAPALGAPLLMFTAQPQGALRGAPYFCCALLYALALGILALMKRRRAMFHVKQP